MQRKHEIGVIGMIFSGAHRFRLSLTGSGAWPWSLHARAWRLLFVVVVVVAGLLVAGPVTAEGQVSQDPLTASRYSIVVDGVEVAAFNHLVAIHRHIGTHPTIELSGPLTGNQAIDHWFRAAELGHEKVAHKDFHLVVHNAEGVLVARYFASTAFPSRLVVGTAARVGVSDVLAEDVTFTAAFIERLPVG